MRKWGPPSWVFDRQLLATPRSKSLLKQATLWWSELFVRTLLFFSVLPLIRGNTWTMDFVQSIENAGDGPSRSIRSTFHVLASSISSLLILRDYGRHAKYWARPLESRVTPRLSLVRPALRALTL